jgi:signal transduction histidine kinase
LPSPTAHDEIYDLTNTINTMLDRLENSFKEIKQFTSDVSHELRNPLFGLKGEMEVALSNERSHHEYREVIQECLERVNALSKMVNDLFLVSRFELKKVDLDMLYLNLSEILQDLYDFFLPMAQEKKLVLTIDRCDSVLINGDKTRVHQLLSNLIDNAIKFTPENGSVILSLTSENTLAHVTIKDTGIGIPEEEIPHIFNRFYQVDKSRSGLSRGAGLGLHICKKIVDAHGGSIDVTSNEGKGVTFTVTLPKAD